MVGSSPAFAKRTVRSTSEEKSVVNRRRGQTSVRLVRSIARDLMAANTGCNSCDRRLERDVGVASPVR